MQEGPSAFGSYADCLILVGPTNGGVVRVGAGVLLVLFAAVLAGCGHAAVNSPSPRPTSTPAAVSYRDMAALVAAIRAAGQPQLSDVHIGAFP